MNRIATTLIALTVLTSTAYAQAVQKMTRDVDDAIEVVDGRQVKHLQLMKQLDDAGIQNTTGLSASISNSAVAGSDIFTFEMISNGNGPISGLTGFDVTTPTVANAYSADWYRDAQGGGSIFGLPNGMQHAGGWYFVVAEGLTNFDDAAARWATPNADGGTYEIRFTAAGGKAWMRYTSRNIVDVPFELWYLGSMLDDDSDDVRMAPFINDRNFNDVFDFYLDQVASGENNDPGSDWFNFFMPEDDSPGQAGYDEFVLNPSGRYQFHLDRLVLMNWDQHQGETSSGEGNGPEDALPETGTTFRISASFPPVCALTSIDAGPPVSFAVTVTDGEGMSAIDVTSTTNASVYVPVFSPGDYNVVVTVTQSDVGDPDFGAVLELTDTSGNISSCENPIEFLAAIHNVGNIALALQPNSSLGTYPSIFPIQAPPGLRGLNAFWPRDGGTEHLFAGALWAGAIVDGEKRVMANTLGPGDWTPTPGSIVRVDADISDQDISLTYDDKLASSEPIGLEVKQESFQWAKNKRDDFIIFTYTIKNTGRDDLTDVFAALWLDPDIGFFGFEDNGGFDADRGMVYQFPDQPADGGHLGLKVVGGSPRSAVAFPSAFGTTPCDPISTDENKYDCMTAGFPPVDLIPWAPVRDFRLITTAQPFSLKPGNKSTVAFGLVMGEDLAALQANADEMDKTFKTSVAKALGKDDDGLDQDTRTEAGLPTQFVLHESYPNPFNPSTTIAFDLPASSNVRLVVFDILGREVARLVDRQMPEGRHAVTWAAGDVPSGLYLYRIEAGDFSETRQMVLLK